MRYDDLPIKRSRIDRVGSMDYPMDAAIRNLHHAGGRRGKNPHKVKSHSAMHEEMDTGKPEKVKGKVQQPKAEMRLQQKVQMKRKMSSVKKMHQPMPQSRGLVRTLNSTAISVPRAWKKEESR
ncbi:unnamed protein product [Cylicocyclus nassatus]|uniref:Uncharacterized protein n=1 Tax=Cylicocyclus nassatus TaxID=53992 RepID=A0AA36GK86_CYLNA|nr:unnamed protein product [Cylicocyclus nassatus]